VSRPAELAAAGDDPAIPDTETLCRRVPNQPTFLVPDLVTGRKRVSSGAFTPDEDGLSVYLLDLLMSAGQDHGAVRARSDDVVVGFTAGEARRLTLGVRPDPWPPDTPDSGHPRNAAHALVVGWPAAAKGRKSLQRALAQHCVLK
jgi:hypothetical protein